jgi:hypothetical protein
MWGAFFAVKPQKNGLSACIFCLPSQAKGYRCNPLRGRKPSAFALGVLLRKTPGSFPPVVCGFDFAEFQGKP